MSNDPIPSHVDPRKLAERGTALQGEVPVRRFERLSAELEDDAGSVALSFRFLRDEQRLPVLRAGFAARVRMVCQRCLEQVEVALHGEYAYAVVKPGMAVDSLPQGYDALEVDEQPLDLLTLAEDELLLALPIVPVHEDCQPPAGRDQPESAENEVSRSNPFSVLAQLKRDPNV